MCKFIDLTGQKFNRLTVIEKTNKKTKYGEFFWLCKCDCGNEHIVKSSNLKNGHVKSCGCLNLESLIKRNTKHNISKTRLYRVYADIKTRCYNKKRKKYKDYGERGIKMCDEWFNNPKSFYEWAYKNGYNENAKYGECTIDRINVNGDYCPENCRWVDNSVQQRNTRRNFCITYKGETKCLAEWCDILNLKYSKILLRLKRYKWKVEDALEKP